MMLRMPFSKVCKYDINRVNRQNVMVRISLCWTNKHHPISRVEVRGWSSNAIIAELIHELTGQERSWKAVSSHLQVLKKYADPDTTGFPTWVGSRPPSQVSTSRYTVLHENSLILTHASSLSFPTLSQTQGRLSLHYSTTLAQTFLPLSQVNHFYRSECLHHLATTAHLSFGLSTRSLHHFFTTAPPALLASLRHLHADSRYRSVAKGSNAAGSKR